ncbi:uncharacterized protein LOC131651297 [Vicia villosa]|uniref:uncharacterized protein LOC131651297 n=1 Tax=Vicia villosa TaxID=3911 RepID=UPI00273C65A3|nr:uncharacterized protein LOC131651297 [Vicia villosa]
MVHPDNIFRDGVDVPEEVNGDAMLNEVNGDVKTIVVAIDVRQDFTNEMTFTSRQHLLEWNRIEASKLGFGIVIARSDNGTSRRQAFIVMTCERGGKYVPKIQKFKHDDTGSRKCLCPFKLRVSCRVDGLRSEMQQLLKLLNDNQYVSRFRACEGNFTVCDIFRTHHESIKLFNTFPTVLITENMVDVGTDGNCGYRVVANLLGKGEWNHTLVRRTLILELTMHRELYTRIYETKDIFDKIHDAIVPYLTAHAPVSKWISFPDMCHLIASVYDKVAVDSTII